MTPERTEELTNYGRQIARRQRRERGIPDEVIGILVIHEGGRMTSDYELNGEPWPPPPPPSGSSGGGAS